MAMILGQHHNVKAHVNHEFDHNIAHEACLKRYNDAIYLLTSMLIRFVAISLRRRFWAPRNTLEPSSCDAEILGKQRVELEQSRHRGQTWPRQGVMASRSDVYSILSTAIEDTTNAVIDATTDNSTRGCWNNNLVGERHLAVWFKELGVFCRASP